MANNSDPQQIYVVATQPGTLFKANLPNINPRSDWLNNKSDNDDDNVQVIKFNESETKEADKNEDDSDIISKYIGHYGWWQFWWTFLLALYQLPTTFHIFAFVFQATDRKFWCAQPDSMQSIDNEHWRNITSPCGIFDATTLQSIFPTFESSVAICDTYEFDKSVYGDTIISEWNLVCDRQSMVSVVEMCFLAGAAVGSISSGYVSDKYGRRHTLMILAAIQTTIGTLLAFSSSLTMYMILRFIIGFASMGVTNVSFVLVVELVSGKWRTVIGILDILPVAISYIIMAGLAYVTQNWRTTQLIISVPWFVLLFIWFYLPESPRWLLANGRINELIKIIETAAKWNKMKLPSNYEKTLHRPEKIAKVSFAELFKSEYRKTTILMIVVWYSVILLYFGLTLHLNNLGGDIYINTVIAGSLEAVSIGISILVVLKLGMKTNLIGYMLVAGIGCILVNFISNDSMVGVIVLAMIGKCTIGATNALIPTFTAVQYPTSLRTLSVGVGNFAAGLALITVPYLWLLEHIQKMIPMTVMGVFGVIGAIAILLMKNKQLNSTINESTRNNDIDKINGIGNCAYNSNES